MPDAAVVAQEFVRRNQSPLFDALTHTCQKLEPDILHTLASFYGVEYEVLMEKAGYLKKRDADSGRGEKTGRLAASSLGKISREEEAQLLSYLGYIRSQRKKQE